MKKYKNEPAFDDFRNKQVCLARIRKGNGALCILPVIPGKKRCFNHGGAPRSGGQFGNQNAVKDGSTTREAKSIRKDIRLALHEANKMIFDYSD
jgi:hypothetical protein